MLDGVTLQAIGSRLGSEFAIEPPASMPQELQRLLDELRLIEMRDASAASADEEIPTDCA